MNATYDDGLLPIGEFSRLSQVRANALRPYHDIGLLVPDRIDRASGYRYYAPAQLHRAAVVVALRRVGTSLLGIGAVLATSDPHSIRVLLDRHRHRLTVELTATHRRLAMVETLMTKDTNSMFDIAIESIPGSSVAYEHLDVPSHLSAVSQAATLAVLA
jgi:DNA-binding transcriptional MerR regulator